MTSRIFDIPLRLKALLPDVGPVPQPVMFRARGGQLAALLQQTWRALPAGMPVRVLPDGQVPHVPGVRAVVPRHHFFLGRRGDHAVTGHANTLATTIDISGEVKRRPLLGLKAQVSMSRSR